MTFTKKELTKLELVLLYHPRINWLDQNAYNICTSFGDGILIGAGAMELDAEAKRIHDIFFSESIHDCVLLAAHSLLSTPAFPPLRLV